MWMLVDHLVINFNHFVILFTVLASSKLRLIGFRKIMAQSAEFDPSKPTLKPYSSYNSDVHSLGKVYILS